MRFEGAVPFFGFSTMPVISKVAAVLRADGHHAVWCVSSGATSSTARTLPPNFVVGLDALRKAAAAVGRAGHHVGQQDGERLVADDIARAPDRMAEAERRLLAGETRRARGRKIGHQGRQLGHLPRRFSMSSSSKDEVEMVLDDALVAAGDENEMLDPASRASSTNIAGSAGRPRSAFPWAGLGRGQEARAETGDGKTALRIGFFINSRFLALRLSADG